MGHLFSIGDLSEGMKTVIAVRSGIPAQSGLRKPTDRFSGEAVDRLDPAAFAELSRPERYALNRKLTDSFDWLEPEDWDPGDSRRKIWKNRLNRLNELTYIVGDLLDSDEDRRVAI